MGIILLFFCFVFCDGLGRDVKPRATVSVCVRVCLFGCVWMGCGGERCISSLLVHYSSSEAGNLEHSLTVGSVTIHLPAISAKLLSCPLLPPSSLSFHLCPFFLPCLLLQGSEQPFVQLKLPSFVCAAFFILVLIGMVVCLSWTPSFTLSSPLFDTPPLIRIPILAPLWYWNPTAA